METIETRLENGILRISLNRPQARNALSRQMVAELQEVVTQASADDSVKALVLRGAGGHFCAGADLADMAAARMESAGDVDAMAAINRSFGTLISAVHDCPKTVVAVVEGSVFGGGVGLACVADVCLVSAQAKIGLPEVTLGLPPAQIIPFVVDRVGLSQARRLSLTGARIDGEEAFRIGLAHALAEDEAALEQLLEQTLAQIQRCAPEASRMTKSLLLATTATPLNELLDRGAREFAAAATGEEAMEGTQAFLQKRPPNWSSVNRKP
ncbi:MAG: enoyl-CoA hydratase/isomerase family protein [Wenzhouxiangella sp.]|nr:enoyl-CoA hydratase/isomerase family protein [Wenzhouxiangella sp.]MCH8477402.1 enoyl-CoA hydratase/isomerase family protein [Wenzhouxiangella sp.]